MIPGEYTITITEGGINDPKALKIHASCLLAQKKNRSTVLEEVNFLFVRRGYASAASCILFYYPF